jgi:pimeloyl-ACP methyl ester carboxylesterase
VDSTLILVVPRASSTFFLLGRYDRHVPSELAEAYFERIDAHYKRLVWFEESAHNPPFEEPDKFNRVLREEVLPFCSAAHSVPRRYLPRSGEP